MQISVIIPCLHEAPVLAATLESIRVGNVAEIIVVDGGSNDDSIAVATPLADRVVQAPRGRARQMNHGAALASGDILLFVHADTLLPSDFATKIASAMTTDDVVGGRFDVRLEPPSILLSLTALLLNWRSRWSKISTGDQCIFVRRSAFERLQGFSEIPLMEDVDFTKRLKRIGRIACLRDKVVTSSRRWRAKGTVRTILLMWSLRFLYFVGVPADRLARVYANVR